MKRPLYVEKGEDYPSKTIAVMTPCGQIYVTVVYEMDGETPFHLLIYGGAKAHCGMANLISMADNITYCLQRAEDRQDYAQVIKNLLHHKCFEVPKIWKIEGDHPIRPNSCSDAIGRVLLQEIVLPYLEE